MAGPETPSLTVVIPAHNRADCIARAVQSVLTSNAVPLEVIVVDDGSTDTTADILARIRDDRVKIIRLPERAGANHARNVGAAAGRAPLLAFLDSDDVFEPARPERLVRLFAGEPDIDATIDGFWVVLGSERDLVRLPHATMTGDTLVHLLITHAIGLTNSALAVRRSAFDAIGGFDKELYRHQDRDFLLRLSPNHRVLLGAAHDVTKWQRTDSMSRQSATYANGLDALIARHPVFLSDEYRDVLGYLVIRGFAKAFVSGHFSTAWQELRMLRRCAHIPIPTWKAFGHYFSGKRMRKQAQAQAWSQNTGAID